MGLDEVGLWVRAAVDIEFSDTLTCGEGKGRGREGISKGERCVKSGRTGGRKNGRKMCALGGRMRNIHNRSASALPERSIITIIPVVVGAFARSPTTLLTCHISLNSLATFKTDSERTEDQRTLLSEKIFCA